MTRAHAKKSKEALKQIVTIIIEARPKLEYFEGKMVILISPLGDGMGAYHVAHLT